MPIPRPEDGELPPPGDAAFDALLDRAPLPGDAAAGLHQLAAAFGELYEAPIAHAPGAEQYAVAAFRAAAGQVAAGQVAAGQVAAGQPATGQPASVPPLPTRPIPVPPAPPGPDRSGPGHERPGHSRPGRRRAARPRLSARVAAIGAAVLVSLGGAAAAAAYTGALPDMLHRLTHHPASPVASTQRSSAQPTTESRSAAPGARHGRCAAYQQALKHGSPSQQREAFRKLAVAAGGAGNVTSYCPGVAQPQPTPASQATHPSHPAHPTHPAHPAHPAHPTHPPHPTHSPHSGH